MKNTPSLRDILDPHSFLFKQRAAIDLDDILLKYSNWDIDVAIDAITAGLGNVVAQRLEQFKVEHQGRIAELLILKGNGRKLVEHLDSGPYGVVPLDVQHATTRLDPSNFSSDEVTIFAYAIWDADDKKHRAQKVAYFRNEVVGVDTDMDRLIDRASLRTALKLDERLNTPAHSIDGFVDQAKNAFGKISQHLGIRPAVTR